MFDVFCDQCGKRQLLSVSRIRGIHNSQGAIAVGYECWCGARATFVTGRHAQS